ncbi:MAG: hypothetical protein KAS32_15625 [Candidatus Peribacteraceae bacterium]|nr:hypothetical protein [Candidatus Peribacteraceae bacterium]
MELLEVIVNFYTTLNGCDFRSFVAFVFICTLGYAVYKLIVENRRLFKENITMSGELSEARAFRENINGALSAMKSMKGLLKNDV